MGYSPRGRKESDTTEQLTLSTMFQGLCGALTHAGVKGSFSCRHTVFACLIGRVSWGFMKSFLGR